MVACAAAFSGSLILGGVSIFAESLGAAAHEERTRARVFAFNYIVYKDAVLSALVCSPVPPYARCLVTSFCSLRRF